MAGSTLSSAFRRRRSSKLPTNATGTLSFTMIGRPPSAPRSMYLPGARLNVVAGTMSSVSISIAAA
ncbi:Uncharacterised protein [Mycobacteroides abscessus subsp. abscessus]|nr:Uncharacterised protein [Mycobacteroides abscessus subsp. abscessus]